jgi:hypothetical protein
MGIRDELEALTERLRGIRIDRGEHAALLRAANERKGGKPFRQPSTRPAKEKNDGRN